MIRYQFNDITQEVQLVFKVPGQKSGIFILINWNRLTLNSFLYNSSRSSAYRTIATSLKCPTKLVSLSMK